MMSLTVGKDKNANEFIMRHPQNQPTLSFVLICVRVANEEDYNLT